MKYTVRLFDFDGKQLITYELEAKNPPQALREALDGYTGLLGNWEESQARLGAVVLPHAPIEERAA